jgi:hypothetical protein
MLRSNAKWLYSPVTFRLPGLTYFEISSNPTRPPPVGVAVCVPLTPVVPVPLVLGLVGLVVEGVVELGAVVGAVVVGAVLVGTAALLGGAVGLVVVGAGVAVGAGRFGYGAVMQQPLESAVGPL